MKPRIHPALAPLLGTALVLVFVLVVWGGVVRLSGSGLAIPDWPLAEGKVLPRPHPNVLIEYTHRAIAGIVGLVTLAIAWLVFRGEETRRRMGALMVAALITLALQVFIGGRVVLEELPVDRVVTHLLLAFTFFALLLKLALLAGDPSEWASAGEGPGGGEGGGAPNLRARGLAVIARVAAGATFFQAGLGAWVSSSGAALACPDFPTCQGMWLPPMEGLIGIHYGHRLGAYVVTVIVLGLIVAAAPLALPARARWPIRISGILLAVQVTLGIGNVLLRVPLPVSAAHLGTALALFGALLVTSHELSRA
jgi:cytochrome c oxidase assembly protein subunit 15